MKAALGVLLAVLAAGCGASTTIDDPDGGGGGGDPDGGGGGWPDGGPLFDAAPPPWDGVIYAHSSSELYQVDPDTLAVTLIGPFGWGSVGYDEMTDIAVDRLGAIVGISFGSVYSVDPDTAACTFLAYLDRQFNGLSFVPAGVIDPTDAEVLVAAALDGTFWRVDPTTGASTQIGAYGGGLGSSGDIVAVEGSTFATVENNGLDWLARINPTTGTATLVGATGVNGIWGLGYWKNKVYGFSSGNQFVLIDTATGAATVVETGSVSWWGAGVTTQAPIIP